MKLAVIGSRTFNDGALLFKVLDEIPNKELIISGGAKGADTWAVFYAHQRKIKVQVFPADWSQGRSAGFARNKTIIDACDEVIAFWDGSSSGTKHSIDLAKAAKKPVTVYTSWVG